MKLITDRPQVKLALQRYEALEKRDKFALQMMSLMVGLLLTYVLLWVPVNNFHDESQFQYEQKRSLLKYLSSTESQARALGSSNANLTGQPLLQSVSAMAQQVGISPNRIQPDGEGVSIWFTAVGFNQLMQLIERLSGEGITVRQVTMDREEIDGLVNARLILRGA